jgi:hypothetical protein
MEPFMQEEAKYAKTDVEVQKKFTFQGFLHVSGTGPTALWCKEKL